ncbi:MAG: ATP-dependent DNA helicase, partial [Deltaproteobacteria bacterium]|nr:ATP-dependent DNA helicase [Deltaproteobacteria bacterium]
ILDSPFNYKEQARTYIPGELPPPAHPEYFQNSVIEIERLITLTDGNALVLCTSNKNMTAIYNALLEKWNGEIIVQGSAPRSEIVKQFIENKRSVLVATASFWQGVDIPGDDLKLVIIDKLPFSSPQDPVTEARIANLKEQHIEPFSNYQIPQAVITLKQGFGRLIRTAGDRGIVAILDSRIVTKHYGRKFINSLPKAPVISDFSELETWWEQSK